MVNKDFMRGARDTASGGERKGKRAGRRKRERGRVAKKGIDKTDIEGREKK